MTLNEFLKKLGKTPRRWRSGGECGGASNHWLRLGRRRGAGRGAHCPISAVAGRMYDAADVEVAGVKLGLSDTLTQRIITAADFEGEESKLRARLLKACGL